MAVKIADELPESSRNLYFKALQAMELRNFGYAISLLQAVLKDVPEFLDGRKLLRKAEVLATKGKKSFLSGLSTASLKGASLVKKDAKAALELAEKTLEADPYGAQGNNLLKEAALAAGMPEIAAFALETLAEANPKDTKVLHELGTLYYETGEGEKAAGVYRRIIELNPSDLVAVKREKDSAANASMKSGGWETAKDYRDLIKNKTEAESLEQQNRVVMSDEMIEQQLVELGQRYQAEPQNVDIARRIAMLYEQKADLEKALEWYHYTAGLTNHTDPAITRKASDLEMKIFEQKIVEFEQWLQEHGDTEQAPGVREQLADMKKQKAEMLIGEAKKRVERNPTDLVYRYELGEQLLAGGQATDAIPELQKARQNPNVRLKSMNLLGQCYVEKNMLDLAVKTFTEAASELAVMDNVKKDVVYKLGLVYEKMGRKKEALDCMKQIYEVDYGYLDVAKRVEKSYGEGDLAPA
jgi:tetratricopeptide (TPR) repeat protein